ncbi:hypothetical protein O181_048829 [Austropuccinia psidii MF-1]|uniref:Uncharacterized protein n=1 Tax=Austropuccinia psidii MF-1 TaxID=1389203 RepID=A0A9Q3DTQ8_9BASI|nr:hypothetical protein [Austropuccinia psidii MF-1]
MSRRVVAKCREPESCMDAPVSINPWSSASCSTNLTCDTRSLCKALGLWTVCLPVARAPTMKAGPTKPVDEVLRGDCILAASESQADLIEESSDCKESSKENTSSLERGFVFTPLSASASFFKWVEPDILRRWLKSLSLVETTLLNY